MGSVNEIADMQERVAATEAVLSAAALKGQERNARLLEFLERVENNLVEKQQQISELEEEQGRSREEIERLRNMLNTVLSLAESSLERGSRSVSNGLDQLIDRLSAITSTMDLDDEEGACVANGAKEPEPNTEPVPKTAPVRERRVNKVLALFSSPHK